MALPPIISLVGVFHSCSSACNEFNNISLILHKLTYDSQLDYKLLRIIENTSLQLMTTQMKFRAKRFYEIGTPTLRGVRKVFCVNNTDKEKHLTFIDVISILNIFYNNHSIPS